MVAGRGPDCISHLWQNRRHSRGVTGFGYSPSATNEVGIPAKPSEIQPACVRVSKQPHDCIKKDSPCNLGKGQQGEKGAAAPEDGSWESRVP